MISYTIHGITFQDGTTVQLPVTGLIVLVGPNNAGKSQTLRDIRNFAKRETTTGIVVASVDVKATGTFDEFCATYSDQLEMVSPEFARYHDGSNDVRSTQRRPFETAIAASRGFADVVDFFVRLLSTEARLQIVYPPLNVDLSEDNYSHPIQLAYADEGIAKSLSDSFFSSFGFNLLFSPRGQRIHIHLIKPDRQIAEADRASKEFQRAVSELPELNFQGDGMRSYAGTLLHAMASPCFVLMIDEPEAFLHPPQARMMGRTLASSPERARQLIVATHSADFVKGVLDAKTADVSIVRLTRDHEHGGNATILESTDIAKFWTDPLLRNSNLLDGLFHRRVVVCEGDSDCRFYSAVLDALHEPDVGDLMFFAANGKQRVPKVVAALRAVGVDTVVVADIDVLADGNFERILHALGGRSEEFKSDLKLVGDTIAASGNTLTKDAIAQKIKELLRKSDEKFLPKWLADQIAQLVKMKSGWQLVKERGLALGLPSGEPLNAGKRVIAGAARHGMFIVEGGELESFDRSLPSGNKALWLEGVMEKNLAAQEFSDVHGLVRRLANVRVAPRPAPFSNEKPLAKNEEGNEPKRAAPVDRERTGSSDVAVRTRPLLLLVLLPILGFVLLVTGWFFLFRRH